MCPWAGGVFSLLPVSHAEPGTTIRAEQQNAPHEDFTAGLNNCLTRDGSTTMLANLPMNGHKITGLATATNPGDAVRFDQIPPAMTGWLASVSALALTADQFPYATDANTAAAADLTSFGRSLIDDADAAAARTTLGLGTLATVSPTGAPDGTKFLRDDNSWQVTATPQMIEDLAEGAVGAPKVEPQALRAPSASLITLTVTNWGAFTGLDRIKCVEFVWAVASGTGSVNLNIAFSNDGGSSWGGTQTVFAPGWTSNEGGLFMGLIDLGTGAVAYQGVSNISAMGANRTLTVPSNCNAVRFGSSLSRSNSIRLRPIGGVV